METKNKKKKETENIVAPELETVDQTLTEKESDKTNDDDNNPICGSSITVVIPYSASQAQGNELRYALRSWQKNFKVPHKIVIIGEREEWFKDEELTFIELEQLSENPQVNTMEALKAAIASDAVSEVFVWSNDDIYLVAPVGIEHIILPKYLGLLNPGIYSGHYRMNMEHTISLLAENDLPILNYGTHTPVIYEKEKLVELLEKYPEVSTGDYVFSSLYFNHFIQIAPIKLDWKTDGFLLPVVSQEPDAEKFDKIIKNKVFLNNSVSGYSSFLEERLKDLFPEESIYEK